MALPPTDHPAPPHRQPLLPGAVAGAAIVDPRRRVRVAAHRKRGALLAGSAIATIPLVILFVTSSRQFVAGLTADAVKRDPPPS